jgi:hypothetical protein
MNRKRKAEDDQREGGNKRRKQSRGGRGGGHTNDRYSESGSARGSGRAPQIEETDVMNSEEADEKTRVLEDEEAANMAKKIRGKKWRDQKRRLGLEEEEDSDASDDDGEGPALGQLGEEGDTVAELGPNTMPFNVREELEGGDFDRGLGAVRRKEDQKREEMKRRLERGMWHKSSDSEDSGDEDAGDRAWYEEQERRARDDKHYYARIAANRAVVDDEESSEEFDSLLARKQLVQQLNYGENVFAAMRRLKPPSDKRSKKEREADPAVQRFNALVESADQLMNHGFPNIYNDARERIIESIERDENKATARGVRRVSNGGAEQYEYKWGVHESEAYGPYSLNDLQSWLNQGHFTTDVVARPINSENSEFVPVGQLLGQ